MLFTAIDFVFLFLPAAYALFFLAARFNHRLAAAVLAGASLFFYAYWNPRFLPLLLGSIVANYGFGYLIGKRAASGRSHPWLVTAVSLNLALLALFKYSDFVIGNVDAVAGRELVPLMHLVLPLGISFFTFTQIAFLVDVHRGKAREYNFIHYGLFVTYFPHLIAGPILHHAQMMPQFQQASTYSPRLRNLAVGGVHFTIGLAKKVVLADSFAEYASPIFNSCVGGAAPPAAAAWVGALAYTFQIYYDFSGYSDMAIGLSRMFGIELPLNFNSPYKSPNIIEFWRRWHMTLSQFLRDYLYISLGGNRNGEVRRYVNLFLTMLLGGLWHGANWTFVFWGGLHGGYLIVNHAWRALVDCSRLSRMQASALHLSGIAVTFLGVVVAWVFFRAQSFQAARAMLEGMAGLGPALPPAGAAGVSAFDRVFAGYPVPADSIGYLLSLFAVGFVIAWGLPNSQSLVARARGRIEALPAFVLGLTLGCIVLLTLVNSSRGVSEFIYFNF